MNQSLQHVSKNLRVVSLCTLSSRVLGLLRDQAMGVVFGADWVMDAFTVAFRLPNMARVLLGEGALTAAFLPVFVADLRERGRDSAARLTWAVFLSLFISLTAFTLLAEGVLLAIGLWFPLDAKAQLLRKLMAMLLPYIILVCLTAQLAAALNALGRFLWPALAPCVLNLSWLLALWFVVPHWSDEISQIHVTAWCVIAGGGFQFLFLIPILYSVGYGFRFDCGASLDRVGKIIRDMIPVVIGLSITQLNALIDGFIAWGFTQPAGESSIMPLPWSPTYPLKEGTATALYLGQRLYQFPLGVFGVALGTVLFPLLTSHAHRGEFERLREDLSLGVRLVIAIGLPASVGLMLIAQPLATLFFQYGKFDADAAYRTGTMIAAYGSGVWAYCGLLIMQRGFYAIGDRLTPMFTGMVAMFGNILLDLILIWPLGGRGLALSTALIAAVQLATAIWLLQQKVGALRWGEIGLTTLKAVVATAAMAGVCLMTARVVEDQSLAAGRFVRLAGPLGFGVIAYLIAAYLLNLSEPLRLISGHRPAADAIESGSEKG